MNRKFRGKFLSILQSYRNNDQLVFAGECEGLRNTYSWKEFKDSLYNKEWCPYIKETFNRFGNAIDYLGRYTNRIAITNSRIQSVGSNEVNFFAKNYRTNKTVIVRMKTIEFIRRLLMHVLPSGFQKIRYYGFLNNRGKTKNLFIIFRQQGHRKFKSMYAGMSKAEVMKAAWDYDISVCPCCKANTLVTIAKVYPMRP